MLGISSYFKDLDYDYLKKASEYGAKYVFTSLHIPEEDLSHLDAEMPKFLKVCESYGLELVPDISPVTFEKLNISNNDYEALKNLGFKTLRLDYGFDDFETIKTLLENFKLMLNASVVDEKYILAAKESGISFENISLLHNFYPKTNTGLSLEYYKEKNLSFKKHGIRVMAFVPGDALKRFPLYEGLPTVEMHRQMNPYVAAVQLIKTCDTDDVYIGDSKAKLSTLKYIGAFMDHGFMTIPVQLEKEYDTMYDVEYTVRRDLSESVIRLATPRVSDVEIKNNNKRHRGSITIENSLSGRYSGEIQITKVDLDMDPRANVIGFVHPDYVDILQYIDRDTVVKFVDIKEG